MTQAITAVRAYVREVDEPLTNRFRQTLVIETTGANTDTAYDLGSYVAGSLGTFWAAVSGSVPGALALQLIQTIATLDKLYLGSNTSPVLQARTKVTAGAVQSLTSAAISSGTSVTATVTGLLATDVIISVDQATANSNSLTPVAYGAPGAGTLPLTYASASGTGGTVQVTFIRTAGTVVPQVGQYAEVLTNQASNITFASTDAPTVAQFVLEWELLPGCHGVKSPVN